MGGFGYASIHEGIDGDLTREEFYVGAASSYAKWIEFNHNTNQKNAFLITLTSLLLIGGVVGISLGVYNALVTDEMLVPVILFGVVYLFFVWYSEIGAQFWRVYGQLIRSWLPA